MPIRLSLAAALALCLAAAAPAAARDLLAGPVAAEVVRVIDGDTLEVRASIWIGQDLTTHVRVRGIDAPEVHGKCQREKDEAAAATRKLGEVAVGEIRLSNVENDKYGGRVIADVTTAGGTEVAAEMLASGLVRAYDGGSRGEWCSLAALDLPR